MSSRTSRTNPVAWLPTRLYIDGKLVAGEGETLNVVNPATGCITASLPGASISQVNQAITAARQAFDSGVWSGLRARDRTEILRRLLSLLEGRAQDFRRLIITETGCPAGSVVLGAQIDAPLRQLHGLLDLYPRLPEIEENPLPLAERTTAAGKVLQSIRRHVPVGVVAGIASYNFPVMTALWKIFPSLLTGNCAIVRPSPLTPFTSMAIAEVAAEAGIPAGVLNILVEAGFEGSQLLTTDPGVDMVAFTGSSDVGKKVMAQGAASMKRLQLELGGKSAQIYMPDSLDQAKSAALSVVMSHAGQGCVLGTRILVPEADKAWLMEEMKAALAILKFGDVDDPSTNMSPIISQAQLERCERYVAMATAAGARVVTGGKRVHMPGFYFQPTILDVADNSNPAAQDEIFGPVVCVIGYRDLDHAVEMANDSIFGLSGYVYGKDIRAAAGVAMRIRSGTVNINGSAASAYSSSGGHKHSGIGRERGIEGIRIYQEIQVLNLTSA